MSGQAAVQTQNLATTTITPAAGGVLQRQCACGQHTSGKGECEECKKKREGTLQRAAINPSPVHDVPPIVHEVLRSPGQPLDAATRALMEPHFRRDFGGVRVHTDAKAAESAHTVNARAYTVGQDIVFNTGRFAPDTIVGRRLLAHELTHTIQQAQGHSDSVQKASALLVNDPYDRYEREAEDQAVRVAAGRAPAPTPAPAPAGPQPQADLTQAPPLLFFLGPCTLTAGPGHMPGTDVLFNISSSAINPGQRPAITAFGASWVAGGSKDNVIVDGWASTDGPQSLNWQLSCDRAEAVKTELVAQGIPAAKIRTFAHGETTEFSTTNLAKNRRAIITTQPAPTPPPPGPVPPGTGPGPAPTATITSETVTLLPAPRSRRKIGVGEQVTLTHSAGSATWATTAGTLNTIVGPSVILTAPDTAQTLIVTGGGVRIAFEVIAPTDVFMERTAGSNIYHTTGRPDSGIRLDVFLLPDTVNFSKARYRELDVNGVATAGVFSCNPFSGGHCAAGGGGAACPDKALTVTVVAGKGTKSDRGDCAISGDCCGAPTPFVPGSVSLTIPYEYKVGTGAFHFFKNVPQVHALAAGGIMVTTDKANAHGETTVAAPTSKIPGCPDNHC